MSFSLLITPLLPMLLLATGAWMLSLWLKDTSVVDSFWSLFFLVAVATWWREGTVDGTRPLLMTALMGLWAVRLAVYLTLRNWGKPEDRRYQAIRERNQPHYPLKSLFIVFYLQVFLAWCVSWPLLETLASTAPLSLVDGLGVGVFLLGFLIETVADAQMRAYKKGGYGNAPVMNQGLWARCRHPNYFGEALLWWGVFVIALAAGAPVWVAISPAFMTFLLLRVSGVPLLEADLSKRHPDYQRYIENTPAFFPRWRRA